MKHPITFLLSILTLAACSNIDSVVVPFDDATTDYTPIIRNIISRHPEGKVELLFEKGIYPFYPECSIERYLCVSNNDNGKKRVALNLDGMSDVSVRGNGTTLLFHGEMVPFALTGSSDVTIDGIEIDWDDHFTLEGEVIESDAEARTFVLKIRDDNPYHISGDTLYFKGYNWERCLGENIVFDPRTRRPYYNTEKCQHWTEHQLSARELSPGTVEFRNFRAQEMPPVGGIWVDKGPHGTNRRSPAIVISDCRAVTIRDVSVRHCGGMAVIAQYSSDITLERYTTSQKEGCTRMVTASADATHFVDCSGDIVMKDCVFESMLDDATNVHGTYMLVTGLPNHGRFTARFGHFQQEGNRFTNTGEMLRFVDKITLRPIGTGMVKSIEREGENNYIISTDFDLTNVKSNNIAVENISRGTANVLIKRCKVDLNRARSLLLSCPGRVVVEDCDFRSMMAGIRICGDANYWFESGQTEDLIIRGCTFRDFGIGGGAPQAILQIDPIIPSSARGKDWFFHKNIVFENNTVETFDYQIVYALSVENLTIRNNRFVNSGSFEPIWPGLGVIDAQFCGNVTIVGNDFSNWRKDAFISIHECGECSISDCDLEVKDSPNPYFFQN